MSQLNDRAWVTRLDPKGMLGLFENFPNQCREALAIGKATEVKPLENRPGLVCLAGMGGSAAGGDVVKALFDAHGASPFLVNRDYHLPNYVGLGDIVFCASYSGNTEETLSAYADARKSGATIIVVTSGGKLAELAKQDGFAVALIPGGSPPRTAMGYMLIPVLVICEKLKLLPAQDYEKLFALLDKCVANWTVEGSDSAPKTLAQAMHGKLAGLYGLGAWQGAVASRWKGQINENSKNLAFSSTYPELNHNEVLGWVGSGDQGVSKYIIVTLKDGQESDKMKARERVLRSLMSEKAEFHDAVALGETLLEKMLSLACMGDFVSIYLAALNEVDPENMDWLLTLKAELAKV